MFGPRVVSAQAVPGICTTCMVQLTPREFVNPSLITAISFPCYVGDAQFGGAVEVAGAIVPYTPDALLVLQGFMGAKGSLPNGQFDCTVPLQDGTASRPELKGRSGDPFRGIPLEPNSTLIWSPVER
jgi:hypothetical protein